MPEFIFDMPPEWGKVKSDRYEKALTKAIADAVKHPDAVERHRAGRFPQRGKVLNTNPKPEETKNESNGKSKGD